MATEGQRQFVADIESAVSAAKMRGGADWGIGEICEMAGRSATDLRAFTLRMHQNQDWDLIERLDTAFGSVNLKPSVLTHALQDRNKPDEPLTLERIIPVDSKPETRPEPKSEAAGSDPADVMGKVIRMLAPLPKIHQQRVISSVSVYYGVGE